MLCSTQAKGATGLSLRAQYQFSRPAPTRRSTLHSPALPGPGNISKHTTSHAATAATSGSWASPEEEWAYGSTQGLFAGMRPPKQGHAMADGLAWRALTFTVEMLHYVAVLGLGLLFIALLQGLPQPIGSQGLCQLFHPIVFFLAGGAAYLWHELEGWQVGPAKAPSTVSTQPGGKPFLAVSNNLWLRQVAFRHFLLYLLAGFACFNAGVLGWETQATKVLLGAQVALLAVATWVRPCMVLTTEALFPKDKWGDSVQPATLPVPRMIAPAFLLILNTYVYAFAIKIKAVPATLSLTNFAITAGLFNTGTVAVLLTLAAFLRQGPKVYGWLKIIMAACVPATIWAVTTFWDSNRLAVFWMPLVLAFQNGMLELMVADTLSDEVMHCITGFWIAVGYLFLPWMVMMT